MRSPPNENRAELLRAKYAELLRLREYVERLENLSKETSSDGITEGVGGHGKLLINTHNQTRIKYQFPDNLKPQIDARGEPTAIKRVLDLRAAEGSSF
jgi:hypothetical protein